MELLIAVGMALVVFGCFALIWLLKGFFRVNEEERRVIEWAWGGYWFTAGPGLNWRPPLLSRVRETLDIREQGFTIFDGAELWIDLVDGSMRPRGGRLVLRITDPLTYDGPPRPVYAVADWKSEIKSLAETQTASYLRSLTIEQALQEGQAGFDLAYQISRKRIELGRMVKELKTEIEELRASRADDVRQAAKKKEYELLLRRQQNLLAAMREIKKTKQEWGIEITQIFIPEYDLSKEVLEARNRVQAEERRARAEEYSLRRRVLESAGTYGQIRQVLLDEYGYSAEEADVLAQELWTYFRGTEKGSIIDIRGEGGLAGLIAQAMRILRMPPSTPSASEEEVKKKKKKKGGREIRVLGGGTKFVTKHELKRLGLPTAEDEEEEEGEE